VNHATANYSLVGSGTCGGGVDNTGMGAGSPSGHIFGDYTAADLHVDRQQLFLFQ
jgi:hypothetical protein